MKKKYKVVVGGTFDQLHRGHDALLTRSFEVGDRVIIGLTSDLYVEKFKIKNLPAGDAGLKLKIRAYEKRKLQLEKWLRQRELIDRAVIIPIDSPYDPAVPIARGEALSKDPSEVERIDGRSIQAIVVSEETAPRVKEINTIRINAGWKPFEIVVIPMVLSKDRAPISSTRLRKNEIDVAGNLILPDNLRPELRKPLGRLIMWDQITKSLHHDSSKCIIAVGDMTAKTLLDGGVLPRLIIVDGKVGRQHYPDALLLLDDIRYIRTHVQSGPGFISQAAIVAIRSCLESFGTTKNQAIIVDGEEDLSVLPVIIYAPMGSIVYYGQPGEGIVEVIVSESIQISVRRLLAQFQ